MNMQKIKRIILLWGDITVLYVSLFLTLLLRNQTIPSFSAWQSHFWPFSAVFVLWIIIFYISNLYNLFFAVNNERFFIISIRSIFIADLLSAVFFYANPNIAIAPKTNLIIYFVVFALLFFAWRRFFNWSLNSYLQKINIAFIGFNTQAKELINYLKENPHLGFSVSLIVSGHCQERLEGISVLNNTRKIKEALKSKNINTLVLASDPHQSSELRSALFSCLSLKINYTNLPDFYETITGKVPIEAIGEMWFLENLSEGSKHLFDMFKRIYDIIISVFILVLTAPAWPLIALLLKIENSESVFFMQRRLGKNGHIFKILKFRTQKTPSSNPAPAKKNDRRTTKVGNFFRKTRIDEIPQIINIILGDMSFIGPRPERPSIAVKLEKEIPFYQERLLVKPGATGWDQVSGEYHSPSRSDTIKKLQYDLFYIKNRSLYLDFRIILKTIATIISRSGV